MRHYKNGPKEIKPIPRMTGSTFHCLIRDSLFRDFAHQYEGENLDRLHGLMHDVAEETLARVSIDTPAIAPPVAAGSVDTSPFDLRKHKVGGGEEVDVLNIYINAWGAQQREAALEFQISSHRKEIGHLKENLKASAQAFRQRAEKAEARVKELEFLLKSAEWKLIQATPR